MFSASEIIDSNFFLPLFPFPLMRLIKLFLLLLFLEISWFPTLQNTFSFGTPVAALISSIIPLALPYSLLLAMSPVIKIYFTSSRLFNSSNNLVLILETSNCSNCSKCKSDKCNQLKFPTSHSSQVFYVCIC